ncbi:chorismate--pyruvate lyase family protein [Balneatrix alpica]|uniref:Probable chorismate pyruvate-lyase n=1 Tax=Balneatrix alpica TaxID=75684 RepID=A0ABV5ZAS6_9GAMM|nr:chorismate lyase [Balneatrix alpica]
MTSELPRYTLPTGPWHHPARLTRQLAGRQVKHWLLDDGSLTRRLLAHAKGDFQVRVLYQGWQLPRWDEAKVLGLSPRQRVWVREVQLLLWGTPWVQARSLVPAKTLHGPGRSLRLLGHRPLGAWLFRRRDLQRGPFQLCLQTGEEGLWGRRSVFYVAHQPLMVSEFFLPPMLSALQ